MHSNLTMKLTKHLFLVLAFVSVQTNLAAQSWSFSHYEIVTGLSIYHGFDDIGGSSSTNNLGGLRDFSFTNLRPGLTIGLRYKVNDRFYVKGMIASGIMYSNDKGSRNETRGYKVNIFATDVGFTAEYYFVKPAQNRYFSIMAVRGGVRPYGNPYGFYVYAGFGGAMFSPSGNAALDASPNFNGSSSFAAIFPIGVGVKVNLMPRVSFNGEFGTRFTTTDRMDGFASPYSKSNDIYYVLTFGVSYQLVQKMKFRKN